MHDIAKVNIVKRLFEYESEYKLSKSLYNQSFSEIEAPGAILTPFAYTRSVSKEITRLEFKII